MMSGINLAKGGRINLSKTVPGLNKVRFGLTWGENKFDSGADYDLDVTMFMCKLDAAGQPKLISNDHFIFYGLAPRPGAPFASFDGSISHSGDNRTGDKDKDDEVVTVDVSKLGADVDEVSFIVTIDSADIKKQNFGQIPGSNVVIYDDATNTVLAKYSLEDDFSTETSVQIGSLYRKDGEWLFKAVGAGFVKGLGDFVLAYGGSLE